MGPHPLLIHTTQHLRQFQYFTCPSGAHTEAKWLLHACSSYLMSHVILFSVLAVSHMNWWLCAVPCAVMADNNAFGVQHSAEASLESVNSEAG